MTTVDQRSRARVKWQSLAIVAAACAAAIVVRVLALDSDAFPSLSWSSALLTDEGFYIHNARNVALFGVARTDQFNNMLIMPVLHAVQTIVFRTWGVGVFQARMITVAANIITLPLFYVTVYRSIDRRTAITATVFLAFDHVYVLYGRLALMDSPAASALILMLYFWVMGQSKSGWSHYALMYCCGISLVVAYAIRGLTAPICLAPFAVIWLNACRQKPANTSGNRSNRLRAFWSQASAISIGLFSGVIVYIAAWYLPNRTEIARVNHYYLLQLIPSSFNRLFLNVVGSTFGDARGMTAYLLRHSSSVFGLALAWIVVYFGDIIRINKSSAKSYRDMREADLISSEQAGGNSVGRSTLTFAALWLSILWIVLAVTSYSPSRYYILGYPAMAIIGAHALWNLRALISQLIRSPVPALFLMLVAAYHITLVVDERLFPVRSSGPIWAASCAAIAAIVAAFATRHRVETFEILTRSKVPLITYSAIGVWIVINIGWAGSWLGHLTFRQRDADRWLREQLPANSVLFGAVAPGLCMNNNFRTVTVIQDLSNDRDPLHQFRGVPQYVLILDDQWRETWWDKRYPNLLTPVNRIMTFPQLLRPKFVVGVYKVPAVN